MPRSAEAQPFRSLLRSARDEAQRRGDRRIGTEHLLLGLCHGEPSPAASALGVPLQDLRVRADALDLMALAAVGVEVESLPPLPPSRASRRLPPLTSGGRAVVQHALRLAMLQGKNRLGPAHLLLALLALRRRDPAAVLLDAAGADRAALAELLGGPGGGAAA